MSGLRIERRGRVSWLVLTNPDRRNALDLPAAAALAAAIRAADADDGVAAVVVTGAGGAFCAGADRGTLRRAAAAEPPERTRILDALYEPFLALRAARKPTIAAVAGAAVGAGLNLVLAADLGVAAESARFLAGFLRIGLHPGGGHTAMLSERVGVQTAAAMLLFGETLDGRAAAARGLVHACVPDVQLEAHVDALAAAAASTPAVVSMATKATLRRALETPFAELLEIERTAQAASLDLAETRAALADKPR